MSGGGSGRGGGTPLSDPPPGRVAPPKTRDVNRRSPLSRGVVWGWGGSVNEPGLLPRLRPQLPRATLRRSLRRRRRHNRRPRRRSPRHRRPPRALTPSMPQPLPRHTRAIAQARLVGGWGPLEQARDPYLSLAPATATLHLEEQAPSHLRIRLTDERETCSS